MGKLLKISGAVVGLLVILTGATLGVLYGLYPDQFKDKVRALYNPGVNAELVTSEAPTPSTSEIPDLGASTVGMGASPLGTGLLAAVSALITRTPSTPLAKSIMVEARVPFTGNEQRRVLIYLPKGFQADSEEVRYPTLYLLHGTPGDETDWLKKGGAKESLDEAIDNKVIPPVIAVFPNGNGGTYDDSEYINSPDGLQPNEDFIVKTVVSYVDQHYPTQADGKHRAVGGLSEGGYGALNLSLRNQDVLGSAISLSGYGNIDQNGHSKSVIQGSAQAIHDNSPLLYVADLKTHKTKVLIFIGAQDDLLKENEAVDRLLEKQGFAVDYRVSPGSHTWKFWSTHLKEGLVWWGKVMQTP